MQSNDPTLSLLAAGFGLGGLGYLMTHPEPSREGILIGLSCLILCAGFSALPRSRVPAPRAPDAVPSGEAAADAPEMSTPKGPQPHRMLLMQVRQPASRLPDVATHRRRNSDRQTPRQT